MNPTALRCSTCGGDLRGTPPDAFCPACLWRELAADSPDPGELPAADALFAVAGHDVLSEIARGGGGIVYRARQRQPAREVALKMLHPQHVSGARAIADFRVEAETVATLEHPSVLPVHAVGEHRGVPYFTMKLAEGGSLAARVSTFQGRWRAIAGLVASLADAVQFAHRRGVIHRDLKPGNVLFDAEGRAYVADFGLAKFVNTEATLAATGPVLGTPAYLAPEVASGGARAATTAADIYGLGAILYELLAGHPPFSGDSWPVLLRQVVDAPPPPFPPAARVPADLATIAQRALAKEPARRFATAEEFANDLRRWLDGRPIESRPVGPAERAWSWARRNPALAVVSALLAAALLTGAGLLAAGNRDLRLALEGTRAAEEDARGKLRTALLSEARLHAQSRRAGQRAGAVAALEEAARLRADVEVRSALASALALPDLRRVRTLPAEFAQPQSTIDFDGDLTQYAFAERDGSVVLRSLRDGALLRRFRSEKGALTYGRLNTAGTCLATGSDAGAPEFWLLEGERPSWVIEAPTQWALHPSLPRVVFRRGDHEIIERDLVTGAEREIRVGGARVFSLSYSPAGDRLAVVRYGWIQMLGTADGSVLWEVPWETIGMRTAWSRDGQWIATGLINTGDFTTRFASTGSIFRTHSGHATYADAIRFVPGRASVVSAAFDRTVRVWDLATGQELLRAMSAGRGLGISPDGRQLAALDADDRLTVWEWAGGEVFREIGFPDVIRSGLGFAMDVSRDGEWLLIGEDPTARAGDGKQVHVWNLHAERYAGAFEFTPPAGQRSNVFFVPGRNEVALSTQTVGVRVRPFTSNQDGTVGFGPERTVGDPQVLLAGAFFGSDWLVNRGSAGVVALWPRGDPAEERVLLRFPPPLEATVVSADLRWAASLPTATGLVRLRALDTPDVVHHEFPVDRAARPLFSPDGRSLVVGAASGFATWTLPGLVPVARWTPEQDGNPWRSFVFAPTGELFANDVARSVIEVRAATDFRLLVRLEPPFNFHLVFLRWSPDGARLYAMGRGPRLFCWDIAALRRELAARGLDW